MTRTEGLFDAADRLILAIDQVVRTVWGGPATSRPSPAAGFPEPVLTDVERTSSQRLIRVDHAGEVCAQALYHAQGLVARSPEVEQRMAEAAREEADHLAWCAERLVELRGRTSLLNPAWYLGSFGIGLLAGLAGDRWSLGFLAETEQQVAAHLDDHLARLPPGDTKSRAILTQLRDDERMHGQSALLAGGYELPVPVRRLMRLHAKVMTTIALWI